jgi:hypothetical protein
MIEFDLQIPAHRETVGLEVSRAARGSTGADKEAIEAYAVAVTSGTLNDIMEAYGALGSDTLVIVTCACERGIAQLS